MRALQGAGVCLHVTSLPGDFGSGEIGQNAKRFILQLEAIGFAVWQILPTGPTGFGDSPYQLQSSFAGNELLIDIGALLKSGWLLDAEAEPLRKLPSDFVDFADLIPKKNSALRAAARRFINSAPAEKKAAYRQFVETNDPLWLNDYALYRELKQQFDQRAWPEWPEEYRMRDTAALRRLEDEAKEAIEETKVLQFFFASQWQELRSFARKHSVYLLGDMPFYVAHDSADAWANPELFLLDKKRQPTQLAGVPPDYFSTDGQLWGNPLYNWDCHAASGFEWWIRRLKWALEQADFVRIDHFRGFEAYWSVPANAATAREGEWVKGPGSELFDALTTSLGDLPIVAEDLGVITAEVDALRSRYGLPGMKVLQFEMPDPDFNIESIGSDVICYTGTHDNDTLQGWLEGGTDDTRSADEIRQTREKVLRITGGELTTAHTEILKLALESRACCVIAPMQDLLGLGSEARLNRPGTAQGNWRWRFQPGMLTESGQEKLREMLRQTNRAGMVAIA